MVYRRPRRQGDHAELRRARRRFHRRLSKALSGGRPRQVDQLVSDPRQSRSLLDGTTPVTDHIRQTYVGEDILALGDIFLEPDGINNREFYMGALDGSTVHGDVIGAGPVGNFKTPPKVVADENRRCC